jgi:hypothetical protein
MIWHATASGCTFHGVSKSIPSADNEAARAYAQALVEREFEGNVSAAARAIGVTSAALGDFLRGTRGAGMKMLSLIAAYAKVPLETVVGRGMPTVRPDGTIPLLRDRAGWHESLEQVRALLGPRFNERAANFAGSIAVLVDNESVHLNPRTVLHLYEFAAEQLASGEFAPEVVTAALHTHNPSADLAKMTDSQLEAMARASLPDGATIAFEVPKHRRHKKK